MQALFFLRSERVRRPFAIAAVVLAVGGLVLHRASAGDLGGGGGHPRISWPLGPSAASFSGPRLRASLGLSHAHVLRGEGTRVYAEVRLAADEAPRGEARVRAPLSLAVVLDTSGSMAGDKIEDAKRAVLRLLDDMHDDDEIAVVRYATTSEVLQPLARVGRIRRNLADRIAAIEASGGTNIPSGLERGLDELAGTERDRVRRVVLVSDGLDDSRARSESLARSGFSSGVTISSLGIGADFDESYMGAVATTGHGNFAYIQDSGALAKFLKRELEETSKTVVENAVVHLSVPTELRFVSASGADARRDGDGLVLSFGAVFAGDERRAIVVFDAESREAWKGAVRAHGSYRLVKCSAESSSCGASETSTAEVSIDTSDDRELVERSRDRAVFASATSVLASERQIEAASAYARGDVDRADRLVAESESAIEQAMQGAPASAQSSLGAQLDDYRATRKDFASVAPGAAEGHHVAKAAAAAERRNLARQAW